MKSKRILSLIIVSMLLTGTMLGCDEKETKQTVEIEKSEAKPDVLNVLPAATVKSDELKKPSVTITSKSGAQIPSAVKPASVNPVTKPAVKLTPEKAANPVTNPAKPITKPEDDIAKIRATCILADGTSTLCAVLVSDVHIGDAKITTASEGFTTAQMDKLNYGLSEGRKLYAYWLSTGHDYDIFGNAAKEEVKNGWSNHMVEAADILRYSGVNTVETKAAAREFQFIAQEIVNYQPYAIKAEGYTNWSKWDGSNSNQSVGATMAMITFENLEVDVRGKL